MTQSYDKHAIQHNVDDVRNKLHEQTSRQAQAESHAKSPLDVQTGGDHYKKMKIQPAYYNWANNIGFIEGSCIKYLSRWRSKGGVEDLRKSMHLHELLIYFETTPMELITEKRMAQLNYALNEAQADLEEEKHEDRHRG